LQFGNCNQLGLVGLNLRKDPGKPFLVPAHVT